jgi:hypothetical protein
MLSTTALHLEDISLLLPVYGILFFSPAHFYKARSKNNKTAKAAVQLWQC